MEIGLDRTKIMTNNPDNLQREMLGEVKSRSLYTETYIEGQEHLSRLMRALILSIFI